RFDEGRGLQERSVRAGVEPRESPTELLDVQLALPQVGRVDVGDLQLAPRGRGEAGGDIGDSGVVEGQAGDGPDRTGMGRFLLDVDGHAVAIEGHDAIPGRVSDPVREDRRAADATGRPGEALRQAVTIKEVVPERQGDRRVGDESTANQKGLSNPRWL